MAGFAPEHRRLQARPNKLQQLVLINDFVSVVKSVDKKMFCAYFYIYRNVERSAENV